MPEFTVEGYTVTYDMIDDNPSKAENLMNRFIREWADRGNIDHYTMGRCTPHYDEMSEDTYKDSEHGDFAITYIELIDAGKWDVSISCKNGESTWIAINVIKDDPKVNFGLVPRILIEGDIPEAKIITFDLQFFSTNQQDNILDV